MLSLSFTGNTGLQQRLQHAPDGTHLDPRRSGGVRGAERQPRTSAAPLKANGVWDLPDCTPPTRRQGRRRDPQRLAAVGPVHRRRPGNRYDLSFSYNANGGNKNLTGSPDYGARDPLRRRSGHGLLEQPVPRSSTASVTGPGYGSIGSGIGPQHPAGCADHTTDLADRPQHPLRRRASAPVPAGRVQRVQHGRHQRPSDAGPVTTARPT